MHERQLEGVRDDTITFFGVSPRLTSFAPQFLVDDLVRSIAYYGKLGFTFGEPWGGFYAIGELDGLELHLKEAPKNDAERQHRREHEHLDAAAGVDDIEGFFERCITNGATSLRPLTATAWGMKMASRVDSASRLIQASTAAIYRAFAGPDAMEQWLPPNNMTGEMLHFDFREGGSYRMRLTYKEPQHGQGKTSGDSDEVEVRLTKLEDEQRIEQEVSFESEDPAFSGIMRVIWTFQSEGDRTLVTVHAENVPEGIRPEDHELGLNSSLENLAALVEAVK